MSTWNRRFKFLAVGIVATTLPLCAATTFYSDRPTFNGAAGSLLTEDFENSLAADGDFLIISAPLDSTSNNAAYLTGTLLPGFQISDNPGPDSDSLIALGTGLLPGVTRAVLTNTLNDSMDILFAGGVQAVGFDFWTTASPGTLTADTVTITVYNTSGVSLGFVTPSSSDSAGTFFGVFTDDELIGRINIVATSSLAEVVDNLSFSDTSSAVPEPGSWMLVSCGLALLGLRSRGTKLDA